MSAPTPEPRKVRYLRAAVLAWLARQPTGDAAAAAAAREALAVVDAVKREREGSRP